MGKQSIIEFIHISIIIIIFNSLISVSSLQDERIQSNCTREPVSSSLSIRFPFSIAVKTPKSCNSPVFNSPVFELSCNNGEFLISIPNSGDFAVESIDYRNQSMNISDPDRCLARRILSGFDLSGSPFYNKYDYTHISFYNCSKNHENYTNDEYFHRQTIRCLSTEDEDYVVVWETSMFFTRSIDQWCKLIQSVWIPHVSELYTVSDSNMVIYWDEPDCRDCENNNGTSSRCEFKDDNGRDFETVCSVFDPTIGEVLRIPRYAIGFSIGIGVPVVVVFALILRKIVRSRRRSLTENG